MDTKAYNRCIDYLMSKNTKCRRRNTDSKIMDIANCKICKKLLLGVE
jgi:hypothetical protein